MSHPHQNPETLIHFVALANRLEREGQYNVAKLARAAVDSVVRQSANAIDLPADKLVLAQETEDAATALAAMGVIAGLVTALRRGAVGLCEGRFTMLVIAGRQFRFL